jgi:hypothetical protein
VDASVLAIASHLSVYSCFQLSWLELEIPDNEVKVDETVWLLVFLSPSNRLYEL